MLHAAFVRSPYAHARVRLGQRPGRRRRAHAGRRRGPRIPTAARSRTSACWPTWRATSATSWPPWRRPPAPRPAPPRRRSRSSTRSCPPSSTRSRRSTRRRSTSSPSRRARPSSIEVRPIEGTNVCHRFRIRHGDVAEGFAEAEVVVEETYRVAGAAHAPMEPHAAVAEWEDGRLTLWSGTQTPFNVRSDLAGCFGVARGRRSASSPRRWAARSGRRPSCGSRRSSPPSPARRARPSRRCSTAARSSSRSTATRRWSGCGSAPAATARSSPRRSTAGPTPAPTPTAARAWRPRWATPASGPYRIPHVRVDSHGDLHEPAAQRRLPRLRRHAVGVGVRAHDGPARRASST